MLGGKRGNTSAGSESAGNSKGSSGGDVKCVIFGWGRGTGVRSSGSSKKKKEGNGGSKIGGKRGK